MKRLSMMSRAGFLGWAVALLLLLMPNDHAAGAPPSAAPPPGLVSWWQAEGNANDSADGNHGTLQGGVTFAPGQVGQAFSFDGVDDYIELGNPANLQPTNSEFTLTGWLMVPNYPNNAGIPCNSNYPIFGFDSGYSVGLQGNGHLSFGKYYTDSNGVSLDSAAPISTNTFHHVAAVHTTTELRLYVDGSLANSVPSPTGVIYYQPGDTLQVGARGCGDRTFFFKGQIDELAFHNRALTASEIQAFMPQCVPPPADMVSWWPGDGNASDIQGGNSPVQTFGTPQFIAAKVGQGMKFDGDDGFRVANNTNLNFSIGDSLSIDAWVRVDGLSLSANDAIVLKTLGTGYIIHVIGEKRIRFAIEDTAGNFAGAVTDPIGDTNFHHIAGIVDRGSNMLTIYLDSVPRQSVSIAGIGSLVNTASLFIGHPSTEAPTVVQPFRGVIDEVEIFNRALTAAEVQAIYNAGSAGKCKTSCQDELAAAQQQVQTLQSELATANTTIQTLQGQVSTLTSQNSTLQDQVDTLTAQNTQLQNQVAVLVAPGSQVASVIQGIQSLLPTAPKDAKGKLEQAMKKLEDAQIFLAAGDLDHALQELKPALQELMNAQEEGANTAALQQALVEGVALRVQQAVADVGALAGSSNKKVQEANSLLEQAVAWLQQGKFKEALDGFSKALQKASEAR